MDSIRIAPNSTNYDIFFSSNGKITAENLTLIGKNIGIKVANLSLTNPNIQPQSTDPTIPSLNLYA